MNPREMKVITLEMTSTSPRSSGSQRYAFSDVHAHCSILPPFKPPKNSDISTVNIPNNDNIKALRERWTCHKKPGCSSNHCFVNPVDGSHFVLGHAHFDVWGSAMVRKADTLFHTQTLTQLCFPAQRSNYRNTRYTAQPPPVQRNFKQSTRTVEPASRTSSAWKQHWFGCHTSHQLQCPCRSYSPLLSSSGSRYTCCHRTCNSNPASRTSSMSDGF